ILTENPDLLMKYKKLVQSKIISGDVFWSNIAEEEYESQKNIIESGISNSIVVVFHLQKYF
ncbi:MAG: hypothetical protein MHPSP_001795, partial [Paramarteilia canceri]